MEKVTMRPALVALVLVGLIVAGQEAHAARPATPTVAVPAGTINCTVLSNCHKINEVRHWMPLEANAVQPAKPTAAVPGRPINCTVLGNCDKTNAAELWMPLGANARGCSKINGCRD